MGIFIFFGGVGNTPRVQAAETYPARPVTLIVPQEAGSDGDINNRKLMEIASPILGKPIIIVNKPGAGQVIGNRELFKAKPDGYTIGTGSATIILSKLQGLTPFSYRDFTLIAFTYQALPIVLASTKTKTPFKTIEEVVSFAKSHPGEVSVATTAVGGPYWLASPDRPARFRSGP
jgi:tripartite-type tricarboxylate transporter receptor subunit TctC